MEEKEKADCVQHLDNYVAQLDYFNDNLNEIERKYGRRTYVVVHNKRIVDTGSDQVELEKKYPWHKGFYVSNVQSQRDLPKVKKILEERLSSITPMSSEDKEQLEKLRTRIKEIFSGVAFD